jgi:MoxR-like ATPase
MSKTKSTYDTGEVLKGKNAPWGKDIEALRHKIKAAKIEANESFFERDDEIDIVWSCLLAGLRNKEGRPGRRINVSMVGEPGVAKSGILRFILGGIAGASFGAYQIHRQSKLEELFGQPKLSELENDRYIYKWEDKAPSKHVILLDEGWNGSSALLQAMHLLLNEGRFSDGETEMNSELVFAVIAANVIPDENLDAMYDRFTVRLLVKKISEMENFMSMLRKDDSGKITPDNTITLDELFQIQEIVDKIEVPTEIMEKIYKIRIEANTEGLRITDRRIKNGLALVRATAFMNGHAVATEEDIEVYEHILWSEPKMVEINKSRDVVLNVANPIARQIARCYDAAIESRDRALKCKDEDEKQKLLQEANKCMVSMKKEIEIHVKTLKETGRMAGKYEAKLSRLIMAHSKMVLEGFGVDIHSAK